MKKTSRSISMLGVLALLPALSMSLGSAGCGGSEASPPRDAAVDGTVTGGAGGTAAGGTSGAGGGGGAGGTAAGGAGGGAGAGGTAAGGAGGGGGGGGAIGGAGGTGVDAAGGSDAAPGPADTAKDTPVLGLDSLPLPDGLTLGDGGPTVILCPADVSTATCATGVVCLKPNGGGSPEGCLCTQQQRWFCPGLVVGDGGVGAFDGGTVPDVGGVQACVSGTASGVPCATEGALCSGVGMVGCACLTALGSLRWACY